MTPAIAQLEQLLTQQAPTLAKTAPKQLRDMQALFGELKRAPNKPMSAAQQGVLKNLFVWQLDLRRQLYLQKIAGLAESVALKNPVAIKATRAFQDVVKVLDEAKQAMLAGNTSALALRQIDLAAGTAKESLKAATSPSTTAAAPSAPPAPKVAAQALKAAKPKTPEKLESFRALPGSNMTAPPRAAAPTKAKK
jgi:hypothetical protein